MNLILHRQNFFFLIKKTNTIFINTLYIECDTELFQNGIQLLLKNYSYACIEQNKERQKKRIIKLLRVLNFKRALKVTLNINCMSYLTQAPEKALKVKSEVLKASKKTF